MKVVFDDFHSIGLTRLFHLRLLRPWGQYVRTDTDVKLKGGA